MNKCKHDKSYYLYQKDNCHIGLYCSECDKWLKWIKKKDVQRLIAKGVKIL